MSLLLAKTIISAFRMRNNTIITIDLLPNNYSTSPYSHHLGLWGWYRYMMPDLIHVKIYCCLHSVYVEINGCFIDLLPLGVKGNIQGNLFKIITKSDIHYYIQAPTHQEKMDWIDAIREQT